MYYTKKICLSILIAISLYSNIYDICYANETRTFTIYCDPERNYSFVTKTGSSATTPMDFSMKNNSIYVGNQGDNVDTTTLKTSNAGTELRPKNMAVRFYIKASK